MNTNKSTNPRYDAVISNQKSSESKPNQLATVSASKKPPRDTKPATLRVVMESYDPCLNDRLNQYIQKNS